MSFLTVASIALAAYGLGRPMIRALRVGDGDALAVGVWSTAAGMIAAGLLLAFLGLAGLLFKSLIGIFTLAAGFWGIGELSRSRLRWHAPRLSTAPSAGELSGDAPRSKPPRWLACG